MSVCWAIVPPSTTCDRKMIFTALVTMCPSAKTFICPPIHCPQGQLQTPGPVFKAFWYGGLYLLPPNIPRTFSPHDFKCLPSSLFHLFIEIPPVFQDVAWTLASPLPTIAMKSQCLIQSQLISQSCIFLYHFCLFLSCRKYHVLPCFLTFKYVALVKTLILTECRAWPWETNSTTLAKVFQTYIKNYEALYKCKIVSLFYSCPMNEYSIG